MNLPRRVGCLRRTCVWEPSRDRPASRRRLACRPPAEPSREGGNYTWLSQAACRPSIRRGRGELSTSSCCRTARIGNRSPGMLRWQRAARPSRNRHRRRLGRRCRFRRRSLDRSCRCEKSPSLRALYELWIDARSRARRRGALASVGAGAIGTAECARGPARGIGGAGPVTRLAIDGAAAAAEMAGINRRMATPRPRSRQSMPRPRAARRASRGIPDGRALLWRYRPAAPDAGSRRS